MLTILSALIPIVLAVLLVVAYGSLVGGALWLADRLSAPLSSS